MHVASAKHQGAIEDGGMPAQSPAPSFASSPSHSPIGSPRQGNAASASGHAGSAQPNAANADIGAAVVARLANSSMIAFKPHLAASAPTQPAPAPPVAEGGDAGPVAEGGGAASVVDSMLGDYKQKKVCRLEGIVCCVRKRLMHSQSRMRTSAQTLKSISDRRLQLRA